MTAASIFNVKERVTIVTGGARGLGNAMAEAMAENGAKVTLVDIDESALREARERFAARGIDVETAAVDVTDSGRLTDIVDATVRRHGRLDVVFANAGMSAGPGPWSAAGEMANVTDEAWHAILRMNLTSVFKTMQAAARPMKAQRSGRIVVTSSIAGLKSEPLVGYGYVATKAAIANLVRQAARELAPYNVMVNAIAPGPFLTQLGGGRLFDPKTKQAFLDLVPLHRIADVSEMKGLALLLGSDASSFITGAVVPIDGGATC